MVFFGKGKERDRDLDRSCLGSAVTQVRRMYPSMSDADDDLSSRALAVVTRVLPRPRLLVLSPSRLPPPNVSDGRVCVSASCNKMLSAASRARSCRSARKSSFFSSSSRLCLSSSWRLEPAIVTTTASVSTEVKVRVGVSTIRFLGSRSFPVVIGTMIVREIDLPDSDAILMNWWCEGEMSTAMK